MITFKHTGDFKKTDRFFKKIVKESPIEILKRYGEIGVNALASATPKRTGKTASSWRYEIEETGRGFSIFWINDNVVNGVNIALILQYGHGTGTGGYVAGRDYINPAIQPIFDEIASNAWKEVASA